MSASKTLITHSRTEHARFLGYDISVYHADDRLFPRSGTLIKTRNVNGCIRLGIPFGKVDELTRRYLRAGKPIQEAELLAFSDAQIVDVYQQRFRGVAEYYKFATDRGTLTKLKYVMEVSLTKTLADKFQSSVARMYRKYSGTRTLQGYTYRVLVVEVPTQNGTRYVYWGGIPLTVIKPETEVLDDNHARWDVTLPKRTDLIQRLQANECEVCGSHENCEVHHVQKLADLKNRWRGRKEKPAWVIAMIAMRRKTLVVCAKCHDAIHAGKPLPQSRT